VYKRNKKRLIKNSNYKSSIHSENLSSGNSPRSFCTLSSTLIAFCTFTSVYTPQSAFDTRRRSRYVVIVLLMIHPNDKLTRLAGTTP